MSFCHLHCHSQGSFAVKNDGCAKPEDMLSRVSELKMPGIAITDHGSMIEIISSLNLAQEYEVKVIPGMEAYMVHDVNKMSGNSSYHITLLAISDIGLSNLYKLHHESYKYFYYKPNIDFNLLNQYNEGIVCLSGCPAGMFSEYFRSGNIQEAIKTLTKFKNIFGDRFYGEIQRIGIPELDRFADSYYDIFIDQNIKPIATNDVHFVHKEDNTLHDIAICINKGMKLGDPNRALKSCPETYLKSIDEIKEIFSDKMAAVHNTMEVFERCNISPLRKQNLMPSFVVPDNFVSNKPDDEKIFDYLVYKTKQGLKELIPKEQLKKAVSRCQGELSVIRRMGFSSYFLIVADFIEWARSKNIPIGLGRGSAAGSLVCYCLKITAVINPLDHGLIFERFLNEGRVGSPPDIDIDVSYTNRQEVISYVREKYGESRVAIIGTMGTFKPKTCIRDVARVLGLPDSLSDQISKCIPEPIQGIDMNFQMALKESEKFKKFYERSQNPQNKDDEKLTKLFKYAMQLEGNKRHISKHAAGVVIAPEGKSVSDFLPVMIDSKDKSVFTAVDMHTVEDAGALKMDFLGLKTLDKIHNCMLRTGHKDGYYYLVKNCDIHNKQVYDSVFREQNTIGIFQFEKEGMRGALKDFGGNCFNDLVVVVSAMRPGPKDEIPKMADVKWGRRIADYDHPMLESILDETYGVCIEENSLIQMSDFSNKKIKDIVVGDKIISHDGSYNLVKRKINNGNKKIINLKLRDGRELKCTPDHKIFTLNGWIEAQNCKNEFIGRNINYRNTGNKLSIQEARLIGYLTGDGCISGKKDISFYSTCKAVIEDFQDMVEQFGSRYTVYERERSIQIQVYAEPNNKYKSTSTVLKLMRDCELQKCNSHTKFVPTIIQNADRDSVFQYLASYFDCDGHVSESCAFIKTVSLLLAEQVSELLFSVGIPCSVYSTFYKECKAYQITIYDGNKFEYIRKYMKRDVPLLVGTPGGDGYFPVSIIKNICKNNNISQRKLTSQYGIERSLLNRTYYIKRYVANRLLKALNITDYENKIFTLVDDISEVGTANVYDLEIDNVHSFIASGIPVHNCLYQEQAIRIFVELANFSAVQADLARRAIGKKKPKEMEALRKDFFTGCSDNKIDRHIAQKIFDKIEKFAFYSFNKSHAGVYAGIAFFTAYCKTYHPAYYMAECFNFDKFDKFKLFVEDCRRMGIPVLPPDINCSKERFSVEKFDKSLHVKNPYFDTLYKDIEDGTECIRFGYEYVKNVCQGLDLHLRHKLPYTTIIDFVQRNEKLDKSSLEWLAKVGFFDSLGIYRNDVLFNIDKLMSLQKTKRKDVRQRDMMDFMDEEEKESIISLEKTNKEDDDKIRLRWEIEGGGYGFTSTFRDAFKEFLSRSNGLSVKDIVKMENSSSVSFLGMIYNLKPYRKPVFNKETNEKSNKLMFFFGIGDFDEQIDIGLFEDSITKSSKIMNISISDNMFEKEDIVLVTGKVVNYRFITDSIEVLERVNKKN